MTPDAAWLARHVKRLLASYQHWTGQDLLPAGLDDTQVITAMEMADFALVSHGTQVDPIFNYANKVALRLFEMSWQEFTALPSRLSAEPMAQAERERLLERVSKHGYIDDYSGIRISRSGRRFRITHATVWNLLDENGEYYGQAALIPEYQLPPG